MSINPNRVYELADNTFFTPEEAKDQEWCIANGIIVDSVAGKIGFHKNRIGLVREQVKEMLSHFSPEFFHNTGGGWSFLNSVIDNEGCQWGEQRTSALLLAMGEALGMVKCLLPRPMWKVMPGGVPYYEINLDGYQTNDNYEAAQEEKKCL